MSTITFDCNVTEFCIIPKLEYEKVTFCFNEKAIVISFVGEDDKVLDQSEIDKKDAIELAKLILLKYNYGKE